MVPEEISSVCLKSFEFANSTIQKIQNMKLKVVFNNAPLTLIQYDFFIMKF